MSDTIESLRRLLLGEHAEALAEARWAMQNDNPDNVCAALVALANVVLEDQ